jgi:hypothetical protein
LRVAVITPLPPESTGVAEFSGRVYRHAPDIDIFWRPSGGALDIATFYARAANSKYDAVVFTLANSNHNYPTIDLLSGMRGFPGVRTKVIFHIHDPVLTNVARHKYAGRDESLLAYYAERTPRFGQHVSDIYSAFEKYGYSGLSALVEGLNVSSIIVHSDAAREICRRDLAICGQKTPELIKLFHPCFHPLVCLSREERIYDVGIFGVADDGNKMTNRAVKVLVEAHRRGMIHRAVMCGYNARTYALERGFDRLPFLDLVEHPTHEVMFNLMQQTRVAIQPRSINTGESSGVIPMLISAGVQAIVSSVGAFAEYPDSLVTRIENDDFENDCFRVLPASLQNEPSTAEASQYLERHSVTAFISGLREHIQNLSCAMVRPSAKRGLTTAAIRTGNVDSIPTRTGGAGQILEAGRQANVWAY